MQKNAASGRRSWGRKSQLGDLKEPFLKYVKTARLSGMDINAHSISLLMKAYFDGKGLGHRMIANGRRDSMTI